ncbi:putative NAD+ kinase [Aspergillus homomorphus CBS 101889]|uniref:ATP-NAD kinase n=1 Tax=Aspergillus homomorphus (strain CBS 101889) TaxID=1450537 RepID=A0A395I346_ASPHC|nr:ATP-NAD kinase [Aspergillus homomorphus CBS 101889]RAL14622.1 ATP-NAD kinase [Aspergillus homomorphus CBS 101889]
MDKGFGQDDAVGGADGELDDPNQVEVVLYPESSHRRKSSLVMADDPKTRPNLSFPDETTACFVHSLIAGEWGDPTNRVKEVKGCTAKDNEALNDDASDDTENDMSVAEKAMMQSRHLTKKQLSDMAWNVRKLSKKLDSVNLRLTVKTVFLVTKAGDQSVIGSTREVARWLLSKERDTPYIVYVEKRLECDPEFSATQIIKDEPSAKHRLKYWDHNLAAERAHLFDFVITLGGDGTVLFTSWLFQHVVPPVLSFALGSLGFLTKFDFNHYQNILTTAFKEGVVVNLRLRFECTIMRSNPLPDGSPANATKRDLVEELIGEEAEDTLTHRPDKVLQILNDVVLDRGPNATMSSIELFGDDEHFTTLLADGVCIATPTGSTAYNLAAGGSLSHPDNPVILITAICAHTLSFRPIILPDTIVLRMGVPYNARASSWASFDGRERIELHPGDYVTVSASRYPFANVLPKGRRGDDWVHTISKTLNWNSRQKQKSLDPPHHDKSGK